MIETTLMTFLLFVDRPVITVELVGSWDNFTKSYPLRQDRRTGTCNWRGCHTFTNITCDGETVMTSGRNGGLKMGGKYWYFYRLDGDIEYHNPAEPSTTSCPFLPGQQLNILEVPMQESLFSTYNRRSSLGSMESAVFTLDPGAKYHKPKPATNSAGPTIRKIHDRLFESIKSVGTSKVITHDSLMQKDYDGPKMEFPTKLINNERPKSCHSPAKQSLFSTIHKMRGSKSAGSNAWREPNAGQRQRPPENITVISKSSAYPTKSTSISHAVDFPKAGLSVPKIIGNMIRNVPYPIDMTSPPNPDDLLTHGYHFEESVMDQQLPWHSRTDKSTTELTLLRQNTFIIDQSFSNELSGIDIPDSTEACDNFKSHQDNLSCPMRRQNNSISSSYNTSENFSPGLAPSTINTDEMSPYNLPQPKTPSISEFGDDNFVSQDELQDSVSNVVESDKLPLHHSCLGTSASMHDAAYPGFQGYSLPKTEHESVLTLRKFQSKPFTANCESPVRSQSSKDLVHSWNDGSQHRMSLLEELVDDLGYLGDLII